MFAYKLLLVLILTISSEKLFTSSSNILFILPLATRSETNIFSTIAKELVTKGHEITYVAPVAIESAPKNIHQVIPIQCLSTSDFIGSSNPFENRKFSQLSELLSFDLSFAHKGCNTVYQNKKFQEISKKSYDLLIINANFNNCFYGLVHKFKAPFVLISSLPLFGSQSYATGFIQPPSYVPLPYFQFSDQMNFVDRFTNAFFTWYFALLEIKKVKQYTEISRKYLGQDCPASDKIEYNVSLVMSNSHFSLNMPRPNLPDSGIEIGGLQCRKPNPLPKGMDEYLSKSKEGFIYISFGSIIQGTFMPENTRRIFIKVLSKLKQNVVWKWENGTMPDLPPNVKLAKWLPQQDILGHPNIKLFITHGGLLSIQEAVYHGVPIIGFPIYFDQDINMKQSENKGFGIKLEISDVSETVLENAIHQILTDPKFSNKAKEMSQVFRHRPIAPLQNAIFWIEYVIKHKGNTHMRSAARDLTFIQSHSIDIIFVLLLALLGIIVVVLFIPVTILLVVRKSFHTRKIRKLSKHNDATMKEIKTD